MTDHELNPQRQTAKRQPAKRLCRRKTLAAIAALGLGGLVLAGCGSSDEEMPPMEEPAGESSSTMEEGASTMEEGSSTMGQESDMDQGASMDSQDPAMQQDQSMDQESSLESQDSGSLEGDDDQSSF